MRRDVAHHHLSARDRLLSAADELFYRDGINSVGVDRIVEHAGVAKATLYSAFGSKDELVRNYLQQRHLARVERITAGLADIAAPRAKILAIFDLQGAAFSQPTFHGCAFLNAAAEAKSGSAVEAVSDEYRGWLYALFAELATAAGVVEPTELARQLVLLYDGAGVAAKMDHDPAVAAVARGVAALLLEHAPVVPDGSGSSTGHP